MNIPKYTYLQIQLLALCACGEQVDDPKNLPELGTWRSSVSVSGVEIEGTSLTYQETREIEKSLGNQESHDELGCTEPKVNSVEGLSNKMPQRFADMCTLQAGAGDKNTISFNSECDKSKFPNNVKDLNFSGETKIMPDRVEMRFNVKTTTLEESGKTETLRFSQNRTFWRVGSCSK